MTYMLYVSYVVAVVGFGYLFKLRLQFGTVFVLDYS